MRKYESIIIFNPELGEAQVKDEVKKVERILEAGKAKNLKIDHWGKKEISYPVGKFKYGSFVCMSYDAPEHEIVNNLSNQLRITDSVLKFQSHRLSDPRRKFRGNPKRVGKNDLGTEEFGEAVDVDF